MGLPPSPPLPPSPSIFFFLSVPLHIGAGGGESTYSVGAHVIWPGESNEQPVCAVPPCLAVTISVEDSTHCRRHCL